MNIFALLEQFGLDNSAEELTNQESQEQEPGVRITTRARTRRQSVNVF
jgi:hypothetical protein